jgi:hypothetical protein
MTMAMCELCELTVACIDLPCLREEFAVALPPYKQERHRADARPQPRRVSDDGDADTEEKSHTQNPASSRERSQASFTISTNRPTSSPPHRPAVEGVG